jgi:hypothetical protein
MTVLRLPPAFPPHFVAFARQYHQPPRLFVSPVQLLRGRIRTGQDVSASYHGHPLTSFSGGAVRVSQVPGESSRAFAPLSDPGRACLAMPLPQSGVAPATQKNEGRSIQQIFEAPSHGFSTHCLRFQLRISLHWQDSLPVGGKPLPDGIRTHWTPMRISSMVVAPYYPNAPGLAWRHLWTL